MRISDWSSDVCSSDLRSSSNVYNQSLLSSIIEADGEAGAKEWAQGVVDNLARKPVGGDTDQIRGIGAGECEVAVANSYYFVRLMADPEEKALVDKVGWVFPNQERSEEHTSELQSLMRISYAVFCLKKKKQEKQRHNL